jgi:hypothetical protein
MKDMETISIRECIFGIWRDTRQAIKHMPLLFLAVFVISLAAVYGEYVWDALAQINGHSKIISDSMIKSPFMSELIGFMNGIGNAVIAIPLIRFSLRDESLAIENASVRVYVRYFIFWIGLIVASMIILISIHFFGSAILSIAGINQAGKISIIRTAKILVLCGCTYLAARCSLVFPHIALGGQVDWFAAWRDTRGHFWKIACIEAIAVQLPGYIAGTQLLPFLRSHYPTLIFVLPLRAAAKVMAITLATICLAWLYKCFANNIRHSVLPTEKWRIDN